MRLLPCMCSHFVCFKVKNHLLLPVTMMVFLTKVVSKFFLLAPKRRRRRIPSFIFCETSPILSETFLEFSSFPSTFARTIEHFVRFLTRIPKWSSSWEQWNHYLFHYILLEPKKEYFVITKGIKPWALTLFFGFRNY